MSELTMGSLFDGIGGFPLAAVRNGITPVWASEIEPFPIEVTKTHFPDMVHVGDITKLNGADLPPVDIICGGSPCQELSQIGNITGLTGEKSGLFYQAIRIIDEMRNASGNRFPAIAVWENVIGARLSGNRLDYLAVLRAFTGAEIPMPASGQWADAGMVRGRRCDLVWRILDAQYWANPRIARRQESFSWQILQANVPEKYYLSPAHCSRILICAVLAGCPPPKPIEEILLKQGGVYPSSNPFPDCECAVAPSTTISGCFSEALENGQIHFPLF